MHWLPLFPALPLLFFRSQSFSQSYFSPYFRMTLEQIRTRMQTLQQQINQLVAELPEDARIAFGTRYLTEPSQRGARKELVITLIGKE